jgi:hypothetical protein
MSYEESNARIWDRQLAAIRERSMGPYGSTDHDPTDTDFNPTETDRVVLRSLGVIW